MLIICLSWLNTRGAVQRTKCVRSRILEWMIDGAVVHFILKELTQSSSCHRNGKLKLWLLGDGEEKILWSIWWETNNVEKDREENNCKRNVIIKVSFQLSLKKKDRQLTTKVRRAFFLLNWSKSLFKIWCNKFLWRKSGRRREIC